MDNKDLEQEILLEYVKYYKKRRLDENPTEKQLENFRKVVMPIIKIHVQRGMSVEYAIKKYHENTNK